jgi:hypothetical protein
MKLHGRSTWVDPRYPVTGSRAVDWPRIDTTVIHYTADDDLIDGDPGEHADDLPGYLRAIQRDYTTRRGYSIGYNFAVDWLGAAWELRGFDYRCAANAGHNDHTLAILMLVDGGDQATVYAVGAVRELVGSFERIAQRTLTITGHGQLPGAATGCPGRGLREQIAAGVFSPRYRPPAPSEPLPPPIPYQEDSMPKLVRVQDDAAVFIVTGVHATYAHSQAAIDSLADAGIVDRRITLVSRVALRPLVLVGPEPTYVHTPPNLPGRTTARDFAAWAR